MVIMLAHGSRMNKRTVVSLKQKILLIWTNVVVAEIMAHPVLDLMLQAPDSPLLEQAFVLHHQFWSQMLDYSCTLMQRHI